MAERTDPYLCRSDMRRICVSCIGKHVPVQEDDTSEATRTLDTILSPSPIMKVGQLRTTFALQREWGPRSQPVISSQIVLVSFDMWL